MAAVQKLFNNSAEVTAALEQAVSLGLVSRDANGHYSATHQPFKMSAVNVRLAELETLPVPHNLKGNILIKMINEALQCAIASHLEGGNSPAPLGSVEKFMEYIFKDTLPSLLELDTDMTPSAEWVAKLKPAFGVWLADFKACLDFEGKDDDEDDLAQDFFNNMDEATTHYYNTQLAGLA
jgi:hypothetical protein